MKPIIEFNSSYALLTLELEPGESIKAEPGAMVAQEGVELHTSGRGGLFKGFQQILGGESFFINTFTARPRGGTISRAPPTHGDINSFFLEPRQDLFIQSGAFLACTTTIQTDAKFQGFRGFFSGQSLFFLRAYTEQDPGHIYYNSYGAIKQIPVTPERELVVDTGHLVAFTNDVEYSIGKVGGLRSLLAGGEGLVMKFNGSGHVWIQTRNLTSLAEKLIPYFPTTKK